MRKIFTLLTGVLLAAGAYAQEISATWTLGEKVYEDIAAAVSGEGVTGVLKKGSNIAGKGTRTAKPSSGDINMTTWAQTIKGGYDADTYVEFTVTPEAGYTYKPTGIRFDHSGAKTGNGRFDVEFISGGNTMSLAKTVETPRTNENGDDANKNFSFSYSVSDVEASSAPITFRLYFYSSNSADGSTREFGLANVVVTGEAEKAGDNRELAGISWDVDKISYKVRDNVPAAPVFSNPNNLDVTFSSDDEAVATVDETGVVTLKNDNVGTANISAVFAGNDAFKASTVQVTVTVLTNKEVSNAPVESLTEENVEVGKLCWTAESSGKATAGQPIYTEAGVLTVTAPFAGKYVSVTDAEYSGQKFSGALQLRTAAAPTADNLTGTENSESTPFVLAPEKNMTFYLFARRQTVKKSESETDDEAKNVITVHNHMGVESTDGKAIHFIDQADPTQQLEYKILFGKYTDNTTYDYAYTTAAIELQAGHTYTVFSSGTTIQVNGFGYTEIVKDEQSAPIEWSAEKVELKLRDSFTAPVLVNEENLPVTFASSDEKVATVSAEGVIALVEDAVGTAVITATYDGEADDAAYKTTKVSVTITVSSNVTEVYAWAESEKVDALEVDELYTIEETTGNLDAGTIFDNDVLKAETVYDAAYNGSYGAEYLGQTFPSTVQVGRVDAAPSEDNKNGTEKAGNSPLVVTAKKNLQLVMFMRRQALVQDTTVVDDTENNVITRTINVGMSANDGKGVRAVAHSDISKVLDQEFIIGSYIGDCKAENNYLNCAVIWNLKAGETYTIFARGTTISMQGLGYVALATVPTESAPIAWSADKVELKVRDSFTAPVLVNDEKLPVTFTSSDETVATVSEEGVIALVEGAIGTAVITATYDGEAEGAEYLTTAVTTEITVNTNIVKEHAWMAYEKGEPVEVDEMYAPAEAEGKLAAGTIFDNDALKAETVYEAAYNVDHAAEYLGTKFPGSVQIGSVAAAPTDENKHGAEKEGCSPLIVTAKKGVKLIMFIRREGVVQDTTVVDDADNNVITHTVNVGFTANDNKGVRAVAHSAINTPVEQEIVFGDYLNEKADGENDYLHCAVIWNLKAGETYTIYAHGAPISMHGLGYVAEKSGLDLINAADADAPVEYYNLQGVRIDNPAAGQVVIRRLGNTVIKVVIR
ncbi:MAG: hypothetical protein K2K92_09330 [Duncaniella sp.]|nr:hypothetical protein [Duncaniella sp.]